MYLPFPYHVIIFSLLAVVSNSIVQDFCVADLSLPNTPSGYPCKDSSTITENDFYYSGLRPTGNTSNIFNLAVTPAFTAQFPAVNGLGVSFARADVGVGGVIPLHTHRASEIILVIRGTLRVGFISALDNVPYVKTLNSGDIFVFPESLLHFSINIGKIPAVAFVAFSSENPGVQITSVALFQNDLPTELAAAATLIDSDEIKKLKAMFGGTNDLPTVEVAAANFWDAA